MWKFFRRQCLTLSVKMGIFMCSFEFLYWLGKLHIGLLGRHSCFDVTNQSHSFFFSVGLLHFGISLCQLIFASSVRLQLTSLAKINWQSSIPKRNSLILKKTTLGICLLKEKNSCQPKRPIITIKNECVFLLFDWVNFLTLSIFWLCVNFLTLGVNFLTPKSKNWHKKSKNWLKKSKNWHKVKKLTQSQKAEIP